MDKPNDEWIESIGSLWHSIGRAGAMEDWAENIRIKAGKAFAIHQDETAKILRDLAEEMKYSAEDHRRIQAVKERQLKDLEKG